MRYRPLVLVTGGRYFDDWELHDTAMRLYASGARAIIHGGNTPPEDPPGSGKRPFRSADWMTHLWAQAHDIPVSAHRVTRQEWTRYGKAAGPMRNQRMLDTADPDVCIAFAGGSGTTDMVARVKRTPGVQLIEVRR